MDEKNKEEKMRDLANARNIQLEFIRAKGKMLQIELNELLAKMGEEAKGEDKEN